VFHVNGLLLVFIAAQSASSSCTCHRQISMPGHNRIYITQPLAT